MKYLKNAVLIALTLHSVQSFAKGGSGSGSHGGDAVVCYNQDVDTAGKPIRDQLPLKIISVELLDFWEWRQSSTRRIDLGASNLSTEQKVQLFLEKIRAVDPMMAKRLREIYAQYQPAYVDRAKIPNISDFTPRLNRTSNCVIEQLAVQTKATVFGQAWIQVDERLYNLLSRDDQAGLALHELLYRFALEQKTPPQNSDGVRYLNFILSTDTRDVDAAQYIRILKDAKLQFDHEKLYRFYRVFTTERWSLLGIDRGDFAFPAEEDLMGWSGMKGRYIGIESKRDLNLHSVPTTFPAQWRISKGDVVYFDFEYGFPIGLTTQAASEIIREKSGRASVRFMGRAKCTYWSSQYYDVGGLNENVHGVDESVTCENLVANTAYFKLSMGSMKAIEASHYENTYAKRIIATHGSNVEMERTFEHPQPTYTASAMTTGSVRTEFSVNHNFYSTDKWTRHLTQIQCLSSSPTRCVGNASGNRFSLKPGEVIRFKTKIRNPGVI